MTETQPERASLKEFMKIYGKANKGILEKAYKDPRKKHPRLSTGFYTLDNILGGGLRGSSYVEIFGPESVGKSYLALNVCRQAQQEWGLPVAYLDYEGTWDGERAEQLGLSLDEDDLVLFTLNDLEENYNFLRQALGARAFGVIVVDSISGAPPRFETENEIERQTMAYQARIHSKGLRVITPFLGECIVILINQIRDSMSMYGDPVATAGGRAIKHYDHMRIEMRKQTIREEREAWDPDKLEHKVQKVVSGHYINFKLKKNKTGRPETTCRLLFDYDHSGVDRAEDLLDFLRQREVIKREGDRYPMPDGKSPHGRKRAHNHIADNLEYFEELARKEMSEDNNSQEQDPQ